MAINSRQKGAGGEREFAKILRDHGYKNARRGRQYSGAPEAPDVVPDMDGFHFEVKRVERLNIYKAMEQSEKDAGEDEKPIVAHRRNRKPWLVTMKLNDFLELIDRRGG